MDFQKLFQVGVGLLLFVVQPNNAVTHRSVTTEYLRTLTLTCDLPPDVTSADVVVWDVTHPEDPQIQIAMMACQIDGQCSCRYDQHCPVQVIQNKSQSTLTKPSIPLEDEGDVWNCRLLTNVSSALTQTSFTISPNQTQALFPSAAVLDTFNISVFFGPQLVTVELKGYSAGSPYDVCPTTPNVTAICKVDKQDVYPAPLFTLLLDNVVVEENQQGVLDDISGREYRGVFSFKPTKGGNLTVTCRAINARKSSETVEANTRMTNIRVPPQSVPVAYVSPNSFRGNTDNTAVVLEETLVSRVECRVDGGVPLVHTVNMSCGGIVVGDSDSNVAEVLGVWVVRYMDGYLCSCQAEHATKCYDLESSVNISVAYGPDEVKLFQVTTTDNRTLPTNSLSQPIFHLCPTQRQTIPGLEIECQVLLEHVNPQPFFQILLNNSIVSEPAFGDLLNGTYVYRATVWPDRAGPLVVTCLAINQWYPGLSKRDEVVIEVKEPPRLAPVLSVERDRALFSRASGTDITVGVGENVVVQCDVIGGVPPVSSVTLSYKLGRKRVEGQSSAVGFYAITMAEGGNFLCSAQHVTGCYDKTSALNLTVVRRRPTPSESSSNDTLLYVGAGGGLVFIFIVTLGLCICLCIWMRYRKAQKEVEKEGSFDTSTFSVSSNERSDGTFKGSSTDNGSQMPLY